METSADNFEKRGRTAAKKAGGTANKMRSDAAPAVRRVAGQAWEGVEQGLNAIDDTARKARDISVKASNSIVAYTKKRPVKALAIAAASGALLHAALKVFTPAGD